MLGPVGCVVQLEPGTVFELEDNAVISGLANSVAGIDGDVGPGDPSVGVDVAGGVGP